MSIFSLSGRHLSVNINLEKFARTQSALSARRSRQNNGTVACISIIGIAKPGPMALMFTGVHVSLASASNLCLTSGNFMTRERPQFVLTDRSLLTVALRVTLRTLGS
jgi:hypothetical protein